LPIRGKARLTFLIRTRIPLTYKSFHCWLGLLAILLACAGSKNETASVHWPDEVVQPLPEASDYPDQDAVILLDEGTLNIFPDTELARSQLEHRRIIKVFHESAFELADITIPYSSTTTISNIRGRTITPDGRVFVVPKQQIYDVTLYPGFIFYSDTRAKRFTFPAVCPGAVLEYAYTAYVKGYTYWDHWSFQNLIPTRLSRFQVTAPAEWEFKWKCNHIDLQPSTTNLPAGFKQTWLWQARDLAALCPEPAMPAWRQVQASLVLSPVGMKTWQDFARWYHRLYAERIKADDAIHSKTSALTAPAVEELHQLDSLFSFVRDEIRYVAIAIGIGGYQPHFSKDIFHDRYGDCKDKVALLQSMAGCCDIDVRPVLISTQQNGDVDTSVVSHTHFNHVIAHAYLKDGQEVWMDPTARQTPFGVLPWFDQARWAFELDREGKGQWLVTPAQPGDTHRLQRFWRLEISDDGRVEVKTQWLFRGAPAGQVREDLAEMRPSQRDDWITRQIRSRFPTAKMDHLAITDLAAVEKPLCFSCWLHFTLPESIRTDWALQRFSQFDLAALFSEKRTWPVQFLFPETIADSIRIVCKNRGPFSTTLPSSSQTDTSGSQRCQWTSSLKPMAMHSPFAAYRIAFNPTDSSLGLSRTLAIEKSHVPAADFPAFYAFLQQVASAEEHGVSIVRPHGWLSK